MIPPISPAEIIVRDATLERPTIAAVPSCSRDPMRDGVVYAGQVSGASEPCPSCGNPLVAEAPFCHRCGAAADAAAAAASASDAVGKLTVVLDEPGAAEAPTDPVPRVVVPPSPPSPPGPSTVVSPGAPVAGPAGGAGSRSLLTLVAIVVVVLLVAGVAGAAVLTSGSDGSSSGGASGGPGGGRDPFAPPSGVEPGTENGGGDSSGGGSEDEYCAVVDEIIAASRASQQQFEDIPEDDTLRGLIFLLGAVGDLQIYVQRLGDAAPPELQPDFEAITGDMDTQLPSNPTDPMALLGIIASSLVNGALHQNSYTRIDQYTQDHCGVTLFGATSAAAN